ncbi:MAG TPA: tol-pal system-associated acyl-CoA thioesterase [Polyangiaceae bacterium]|nr:tol-pal system-associated acyl-CoA thioesterase [Polyangiaceae bacterium]
MLEPVRARVYLEDTDAGGIVYHASYLRYMERARTEALRQAGIQQSQTFQQDLSFVLHSMTIRFHAAARLDDEIEASCLLTEARAASLCFRQEVKNSVTGQLYSSADVVVACIRLSDQRPRRVPPELIAELRVSLSRG